MVSFNLVATRKGNLNWVSHWKDRFTLKICTNFRPIITSFQQKLVQSEPQQCQMLPVFTLEWHGYWQTQKYTSNFWTYHVTSFMVLINPTCLKWYNETFNSDRNFARVTARNKCVIHWKLNSLLGIKARSCIIHCLVGRSLLTEVLTNLKFGQ